MFDHRGGVESKERTKTGQMRRPTPKSRSGLRVLVLCIASVAVGGGCTHTEDGSAAPAPSEEYGVGPTVTLSTTRGDLVIEIAPQAGAADDCPLAAAGGRLGARPRSRGRRIPEHRLLRRAGLHLHETPRGDRHRGTATRAGRNRVRRRARCGVAGTRQGTHRRSRRSDERPAVGADPGSRPDGQGRRPPRPPQRVDRRMARDPQPRFPDR